MANKECDQLDLIVTHLKTKPDSRRAVLQMWNVEDDLLKVNDSRGVCCNTSVMFALRPAEFDPEEACDPNRAPAARPTLDMTVTNRSNDLVWGLLGANYVTFSVLQEYVAARLGAAVGRYHHFTNDLHAYEWNWRPAEWLADKALDLYGLAHTEHSRAEAVPLVKDPAAFEDELKSIVNVWGGASVARSWSEPFLGTVAYPALMTFLNHKEYRGEPARAADWAGKIADPFWRASCSAWLARRRKGVTT